MKLVYLFLATSFCVALHVKGQEAKNSSAASSCQVDFTQPANGDPAGMRVVVSGTAQFHAGRLWILAHKHSLGDAWWPQNEAVIERKAGSEKVSFELEVALGVSTDSGQFDVVAILVDDSTHQTLRQWLASAPSSGYPPIQFPAVLRGCMPAKLTLMR